jgi:5'-nucleotidase
MSSASCGRLQASARASQNQGLGAGVPFAAAEAWAERVLKPLTEQRMPAGTLVNVNFPTLEPGEIKGVRICRQGLRDYGRLRIIERTDPRGFPYFWFGLAPTVETPGHQTDLEAIADGYVTVTLLHLDLTYEPAMPDLEALFG